MCTRVLLLLMRPTSSSFVSWIVVAVAVVFCYIAALARSRSIGADEWRGRSTSAAAMARLLLNTDDLRSAPAGASGHLARALRLSAEAIELGAVAGEERHAAFALRDGGRQLVPADLRQTTERNVRERLVASVELRVRAARGGEEMGSAVDR